jgi:hypothetical protein
MYVQCTSTVMSTQQQQRHDAAVPGRGQRQQGFSAVVRTTVRVQRCCRSTAIRPVPAWLAAAAARKEFILRAGLAAVTDYECEHSAFTPAELADADRWAATALGQASPPVYP